MKLRNLYYLLLALPLAFASCETLGTETEEPVNKDPKLTVTTLAASFDADGGPGVISYTFENAPEGATVSATANDEWVNEINVGATMITYNVDANASEEARETKVVVSYEAQVFEVVVSQEGKEPVVVPATPALKLVSGSEVEYPYAGGAGSVEFTLENPVAGVAVVAESNADWVTISKVAENAVDYSVAANEGEARETKITLTYGLLEPVEVTIKQAEYIDPSTVKNVFEVFEVWATSENGGLQWDVMFVEHDDNRGDMQTRISFALAEANTQRITDGTYTVENGGILVNTASLNGFSTYHCNSDATDIHAASFEVATDTVNKTISIVGTFSAADLNIEINYNGEMRGMDLGEAVSGAINHTEWTSVTKNWHENKELLFTAVSADGSLTAVFDFYDYDSAKSLAAGTYEVSAYYDGIGAHLRASSYFNYNGVEAQLASGSAIVEHIAGGYKITYNVVDKNDREFTGVIEGAIEGAVNPE